MSFWSSEDYGSLYAIQFVYYLSFYLLMMNILHCFYCVLSLCAILNTPQLLLPHIFQNFISILVLTTFFVTTVTPSIYDSVPSFSLFFFSPPCFLIPTWTMPCLVTVTGHSYCHTSLSGPQRGSLCPILTAFCPLPCPKSL